MKLTSEGKTGILDLKDCEAMFLNALSHEAENWAVNLELLVVELKK